MQLRFWGVRGSIPSPTSSDDIELKIVSALLGAHGVDLTDEVAVRDYVAGLPVEQRGCWGGNTTCLEVQTAAGDHLIFDAGSGIVPLGDRLLGTEFGRGEGRAAMVFTHTHWDHIQGFPFFKPLYIPGNQFDIFARHDEIEKRLTYQHDFRFFPVGIEVMGATKRFHEMPEHLDLFDGRVQIDSMPLDHPGQAYAYRVTADGHTFVLATDAEYKELGGEYWQHYVDFYRDADVLIFDAQYTLREALVEKQNWGHSSAMIGIEIATDAHVKQIVMVHHEPSYPDQKIKQIFDDALRYLDRVPSIERPIVSVGHEGQVIHL